MSCEPNDASLRLIGFSAAILVFWIAGAIAAAAWFYVVRYPDPPAIGSWRQTSFTRGPEERTSIAQDWSALERETRQRLETYAWIDRDAGIAQIPIERAMELLARRGSLDLHGGKPASATPTAAPPRSP